MLDTFWFGGALPKHADLTRVRGDMRDAELVYQAAKGCDAVIHLACISNDTSFALDERLSTTINLHAFEPLVRACNPAFTWITITADSRI